jgi:membrane peptidoglycan carboxypeptidase
VARRGSTAGGRGRAGWRSTPDGGGGSYGPGDYPPSGSNGPGGTSRVYGQSSRGNSGGRGGGYPGAVGAGSAGNGRPGYPATGATGVFPPAYVQGPDGYQPAPGGHRPPAGPGPRRLIDYPRYGRDGWTRWVPSWKLVSAICGVGLLLVLVGVFAAYSAVSLPKEDQAATAQTTIVYYSDGETELGRLATQNRQNVTLAQVPLSVRQAVLAAEDHTFYSNSGVDPRSVFRAAWSNLRGNSLQGGSTISQQYVKNVYDQRDRSFKRKFKEMFLAVKINREVSKDKILERYLNTIYFGRGSYGIQAASQAYFHKDVGKLTPAQGAYLAGIINAPSLGDPLNGPQSKARAERRWNVVMDAMVTEQWLSPTDRAAAKFPKVLAERKPTSLKGQNGYLMEMVQDEAEEQLHLDKDDLQTGGYKIVTTFNKRLINAGVKAVKDQLPKNSPQGLRVGMVSMDPESGAVRAIYGGTDYFKQYNQATKDTAQAGSTFKAFALLAALKDGVSLKSYLNGSSPLVIKGEDKPIRNFANEQPGYVNLLTATEESVNTAYVRLNQEIKASKTKQAALDAGIPEDANVQDNLANVLGTADPHTIDMAAAYSTIASGGIYHKPYVISSASEIGSGKEFWKKGKTSGDRRFSEDVTADATYALQQVVAGPHGTGAYVRNLGRPVAGKTGTSSDSMSAWFVGFTPQLTTAVSMHRVKKDGKTPRELGTVGYISNVTGGSYPARIWTDYMKAALEGKPIEDFQPPVYGGEIKNGPPVTSRPTITSQPTGTGGAGPTSTPSPSGTGGPGPGPRPTKTRGPRPTRTNPFPTISLPGGNDENP